MADSPAIGFISLDRPIVDGDGKPTVEFIQAFNDLLNRTGGETSNVIAATVATAAVAQAAAQAVTAGAVPAGGYSLDPANPLSTSSVSLVLARIIVSTHTRIEGGVTTALPSAIAGDPVARGATYFVYYTVPGTYLTTTDANVVSNTPGAKLIGSIYVPNAILINRGDLSFQVVDVK